MIVSVNELQAMCAKAVSGAGRPWGIAQEAARACGALEASGEKAASALLALLKITDNVSCADLRPVDVSGAVWAGKQGLCPILTGAYIADLGGVAQPVELQGVHSPLLLKAFILDDGFDASNDGNIRLQAGALKSVSLPSQGGPVDIADDTWEGLSKFAHRTYVPATEASRLKGAGAGLTDND